MFSTESAVLWDQARRSFWLIPALSVILAILLGVLLPYLDYTQDIHIGLIDNLSTDITAILLSSVATATLGVAGVSFSVTVVALQLASQQLSPRVLRTFQADRLNQLVLALLIGSFVYNIMILLAMDASPDTSVPHLSTLTAIVIAFLALVFFIAFLHNIVMSIQASTLIRRIAADSHTAIDEAYPGDIGQDPFDQQAISDQVKRRKKQHCIEVRAPRAGYITSIHENILENAAAHDVLVEQRINIGEFVVSGGLLAVVWSSTPAQTAQAMTRDICKSFQIGDERTLVQDVSFAVRQLSDVALKGLSPGINDPTTAENALNSCADTLVRFASKKRPSMLRTDAQGKVRFIAASPDLNALILLGFDQVRVKSSSYPAVSIQMLRLHSEIRRAAAENGVDASESLRQAKLIREDTKGVPTKDDTEQVNAAYRYYIKD